MADQPDQGETSKQAEGKYRQYGGSRDRIIRAIAIIMSLYVISDALNLPYRFGISYYRGQHNALFLCFVLVLVFALVPSRKGAPKDKLPWYDILLILGSIAGTLYIYVNFEAIGEFHSAWATPLEQVLASMTLVVVFEAVRRTIGWAMVILAIVFFLYVTLGHLLPPSLYVPKFSFARLMATFYIFNRGIFSSVLEMAATLIVIFIIFGSFLRVSGAADYFVKLALALVGSIRGGPAKVAVVASALFGTLSGSPAANVAITGSITIPMMKTIGYRPQFAAAVEGVASTGGIIMPPVMGVVAFLIADFTGVGYAKVCLASLLPALLYFVCFFIQIDLEAVKLGLRGLPRKDLPPLGPTLKEGWTYIVPLILLVFLLMILEYNPMVSCLYAMGTLIGMTMLKKEIRMGPRKILKALEGGALGVLEVGALCAVAGVVVASLAITGLGVRLSSILVEISGGQLWILLCLAGLTCYILGMGISSIAAYILLSILIAPALVNMGLPVLAAHLFILYMGATTMITPPFCPAIYVASGIAGSPMLSSGFLAVRLGIVLLIVPFMFAYKPALLLTGTILGIGIATLTSFIGVAALAMGLQGYMFGNINWVQRALLILGAMMLVIPGWSTDLMGVAILASLVLSHYIRRRQFSLPPVSGIIDESAIPSRKTRGE